ncbi:MAG: putative manganese transporter [candidate division WOR-3 bacterium]|nr:putative manganese transporter [candidate division WOR-3 bacterium]MDH5683378.1 putative manganese transporter [candidate division WOR-3 bacterium]
MQILIHNLKHGLMISIFVFVMMIFIDYLSVLTKGKMNSMIKGSLFRQYLIAAFLGATPGCLGAFMCVSFYVHGLISFGALAGCMIATAGDESYVMFAMIPKPALAIHVILFILGVIAAWFIDKAVYLLKIKPCQECQLSEIHLEDECRCLNFKEIIVYFKSMSFARFLLFALLLGSLYGFISGLIGPEGWNWQRITFVSLIGLAGFIVITVPEHYLEEHIWKHIAKEHLWRIFLWTFGALLIVDIGLKFWHLETFVKEHMFLVLLIAAIVGLIPESGPHLMFVTMFAKGLAPFSVLLTSSIVQDGHGMLPLLSYTIKDSLRIKLFNLIIGLVLGIILFSLGY